MNQQPVYPGYEPLTSDEMATLTRLARKAVGTGVGAGAVFEAPSGHDYAKRHEMWKGSFIKFGMQLNALANARSNEMNAELNMRGINCRDDWASWRSEAEIAAEKEVAQILKDEQGQ